MEITTQSTKLERLLEKIHLPGFSASGHGTSEHVVNKILEEGLEARSQELSSTARSLSDPSLLEEPWPHRNYRRIVIIQIPNPREGQQGGLTFFNNVFEELPAERQTKIGVQGADRSYVIPPKFIQGYINLDTLEFIENPKFSPPTQLEDKRKIPDIDDIISTTDQVVANTMDVPKQKAESPASQEGDDVW